MKLAYIFLNGELQASLPFVRNILEKKQGDIFCVDGGSQYLEKLNILPLELWGDFDSSSQNLVQNWQEKGVILHQFPIQKDFTDFELILLSLENRKYDKIVIFGGLGGDSDHFLTNILFYFRFPNIEFLSEKEHIFLAKKQHFFHNQIGQNISFLSLSEKITHLHLEGFQYTLNNYTLKRGESLCHGNTIIKKEAFLQYEEGLLLAILKR